MNSNVLTFEDFSNQLSKSKEFWKNCSNTLMISEDSLQRTLTVIQNSSFAILTAYQHRFNKQENIIRNQKLRAFLNQNRIGVHQLVGHYEEIQPDGLAIDVVERSYLIDGNSQITLIGTKLTIGKISKIYLQHIKKLNVLFKFEGEEIPTSNFGCLAYSKNGYAWKGHNGFGY